MTQSQENLPLAFSTQSACQRSDQQSDQLSSEQETAADLCNSMSSRFQDDPPDSIEPPVILKKKVSLVEAMCTCPQMLTSCEADHLELEGGHELPHQHDEGLAHQVPQQGEIAERLACIDLGSARTGENDAPTVVEPWIELKRAASVMYASPACSARDPDPEVSTNTNS